MKLTVIIVCWNGLVNLKTVIPSLKEQTFKDFEILVSDNGSTDGSIEWLKKNKIEFIENGKNLGFSEGNNVALRAVTTEYVALVNDDTRLERKTLEKLVKFIESKKVIGSVQPVILSWDGKMVQSTGLVLTHGSFIAEKNKGRLFKPDLLLEKPEEVLGTQACCAVYRTKLLEKIGFFDELFSPAYYEDADLSLEIRKIGFKNFCIKNTVIRHKGGFTAKRLGYPIRLSVQRNRYKFLKKHGDVQMWIKTIMWFPFVTGFYLFKKPERAYCQDFVS